MSRRFEVQPLPQTDPNTPPKWIVFDRKTGKPLDGEYLSEEEAEREAQRQERKHKPSSPTP